MTYTLYKHTCRITGKSYVGMTKKTIDKRWSEHVALAYDARPRGVVRRSHFQNAIKKHGVDAWDHVVLCEGIETQDLACVEEVRFISELNTLAPNGYNETYGGRGIFMTAEGKKRHAEATRAALACPDVRARYLEGIRRGHSTPEFLEKNRIAQKLAQNRPDVAQKKRLKMKEYCNKPGYVSPVARSVEQLTKDGKRIAVYASATLASKVTGTNYTKLTEVARGLRRFSGGFAWRYLESEECDE